ncbi:MAG: PHP domain-containing protein [Bacilli bacterium]
MRVNLHTHSNASDGKLSPSDLIDKLACNYIEIIALTDHDTINGIEEAKIKADLHGIKFINGIEISTSINGLGLDFLDENKHSIHLLGINFDIQIFKSIMNEKEIIKKEKIKNLIDQLIKSGYKIDNKDYGSKKTFVAEELVKKGYAKDNQEAFNKIINNFYPRNTDLITVDEVVRIIHKSNGKVIWAHPYEILHKIYKYRITEEQIDMICEKLKNHNIDGIEVYYGNYDIKQIEFLKKIQQKYNFIASAGTDFHNKVKGELTFIDIDIKLIKEALS